MTRTAGSCAWAQHLLKLLDLLGVAPERQVLDAHGGSSEVGDGGLCR